MTTGGQSEDFEGSESEIKRPAGNGSGGAPPKNDASSFSITRRGSSGPRTVEGKERSKHNAVKHGIFSEVVVLKGESRAEFNALMSGLYDDFQPVGTLEEGYVEMLAVTRWRQRRLLIAEGAEIEAGRKFIEWDVRQRCFEEAGQFLDTSYNGGLVRKITNPEALQACLNLLEELGAQIKQNGFHPEGDEGILTALYGQFDDDHWERTLFNSYRIWLRIACFPDDVREQGKFPSPEKCKKNFLEVLADEIKRLLDYDKERSSIESNRMKLESLQRSVPDSPRLDALLRYSASLDRAFDRTLSQLERAQRMRRGQPVAPRIDVNVSSS